MIMSGLRNAPVKKLSRVNANIQQAIAAAPNRDDRTLAAAGSAAETYPDLPEVGLAVETYPDLAAAEPERVKTLAALWRERDSEYERVRQAAAPSAKPRMPGS